MKQSHYYWHGINQKGNTVSGEILAFSLPLAKLNLIRKGIQLTAIQKKRRWLPYANEKISPFDIVIFFRQLSTLILAGIPIAQAIQVLGQQVKNEKLKLIIATLNEDISAGKNLTFSLQKFPQYFDKLASELIAAGEKSGTLDIMLERIAQHKEKMLTLKNKIKQALFYPLTIVCTAIVISAVMLTCVVPRFADLFQTMHSQLPPFTRGVIWLANLLRNNGVYFLFFCMIGSGYVYYFRHSPRIRKHIDWALLNLPLFNTVLKKIILVRFTRNLATLFAAGIPITEALNMIAPVMNNSIYTALVQKLYFDITTGKQLHAAMQSSKLFPIMMLQMIQIGEESGTLEKMLMKVTEFYEADIDHVIANLNRFLEPLIMIILGVLIGGLVIAMYLPVFKLGTVI